ncbi:unnamed protein product [Ectocarpus fasciculatus]
MDAWDETYGVYTLDEAEGTFNDDFHTFGLYWDENEMYTYIDEDSNRVLSVDFGEGSAEDGFWEKGGFEERFPGVENPWKGANAIAPYDQKFYVVMNVAVGGVSGFFPDGEGGKMWADKDSDAAMKFHETTHDWHSTWDGKGSALQIESVKVWQTNPDYFMDARAAAGAGAIASSGDNAASSPPSLVAEDVPDAGSSGGGGGAVMLYVGCSVLGGVLGGVVVGWWLGNRDSRNLSRVYDRIDGSGRATPAL